jgi:hypothetical protein
VSDLEMRMAVFSLDRASMQMFLTRICVWALGSAARAAIRQRWHCKVSRSLSSARFVKSLKAELLLSTHLNESHRIEKCVRRGWMSWSVAEDVGQVIRVSDPPAVSSSPRSDG